MRITIINLLVALIIFTIIAIGILYYTSSDSASRPKSTPTVSCDPTDPSTCKDGSKCIQNVCELLPLADGAYCDDDSECNTETSKCVNNQCKITCTDPQNSRIGTCVAVADVVQVCVNGFCQNYLPDGSACSMDSECEPLTSSCVNQVCAIPSNTDCSPTNTTGTCTEVAGVVRVCNALGQCVNPDTLPCATSNPHGTCTDPTYSCNGGSCTAPNSATPCSPSNLAGACPSGQVCSPTAGSCIPQYKCSPNNLTGACPTDTPPTTCVSGWCTDTANGCSTTYPNGFCADKKYVCDANNGECDTPAPPPGCGIGAGYSVTGTCPEADAQCFNGECYVVCGTNRCDLGAECGGANGTSCIYPDPIKECQYDYGVVSTSTACKANYPICSMYVPASGASPEKLGICVTQPNICTQDSDCQNTAYPNGECVQGSPNKTCAYPTQRPADVPSNLTIVLNKEAYTPTEWNDTNSCSTWASGTYSSTWTPSPAIQPCGSYGDDYNTSNNSVKNSTQADSPPGFSMDCICDTILDKFCWAGKTGYNTNYNLPAFYNCT